MEMISVFYVCTLIYKRLAINSTQPIVLQLINRQCYVSWQIILLSVIPPNTSHITSFPSSRQTPSSSGMHGTEPESLWPGKPVSHLASPQGYQADQLWRTPKRKEQKIMRCVIESRTGHTVCNSIFIHNNRYKIETFSTLVCPNLYSSWSTSMDPKSFSAAFLLSMNWPSGITLAFSTLYLLSIIRKTLFTPYNTYMKCVL